MAAVTTFELHASDPDRSAQFYEAVLEWRFIEHTFGEATFWEIITGGEEAGAKGRMIRRMGPAPEAGAPVMGAVITVDVEDIVAVLARAEQVGASVAMAKFAMPGIGWAAYLHDPDSNVFGLFQRDAAAA
jgi:predicted enzyme related to lactoylglutathione lyase